jgi:hypothetical protein
MVSLTYEYARSQAWLDALQAERDPHAYDLCHRHADACTVPLGWRLEDRRRPSLRRLERTGTDPY